MSATGERPSASGTANASSNFVTLKEIGNGSFATVLLAEHVHTKKRYAVKRIANPKPEGNSVVNDDREQRALQRREELIVREVGIWWELEPHPGIVPLVEAFRSKNNTYLVMELMEGGSLEDVLQMSIKKKSRVSEDKMRTWFVQIIDAVVFLHSKGVVHRDLKPANVLLSKNWSVAKLCDFGLAREHPDEGGLPTKRCGSFAYMAAEAWQGNHDGFKADMWALGVTLFEMLTTQLPFNGRGPHLQQAIQKGEFAMPSYLSRDVQQLLLALLAKDPRRRPAAHEVASHPWVVHGKKPSPAAQPQQANAGGGASSPASPSQQQPAQQQPTTASDSAAKPQPSSPASPPKTKPDEPASATVPPPALGDVAHDPIEDNDNDEDKVEVLLPMAPQSLAISHAEAALAKPNVKEAESWLQNEGRAIDAQFDVPAAQDPDPRLINADDITRALHQLMGSSDENSRDDAVSPVGSVHASSTVVQHNAETEDFAIVAEFVSPSGICAARMAGKFAGTATTISVRRIRGQGKMFREVVSAVQADLLRADRKW